VRFSKRRSLEKDEIETVLHSDAYGEAVKRYHGAECRSSRSSFFVSTINMLFLELNTLKPCENIRESGKKAILTQNYCIELSK
jgi:hypothetical protein